MTEWPEWWEWEQEFTAHPSQRMEDRGFDEIDLRLMLELSDDCVPAREPGRWLLKTHHDGRLWHVVVEPDADDQVLVVVTAFPVG